jgi:adenylate cyclase class 2
MYGRARATDNEYDLPGTAGLSMMRMGIEIEKKFRLTSAQREKLLRRLPEAGAVLRDEEFEENTLFQGNSLDLRKHVLRLRCAGEKATLTFKERSASSSMIKHQREDETRIEDPTALRQILAGLGFMPALVYEKRRATWNMEGAEIVVDQLPFGLFVEIEGTEKRILEIEKLLGLTEAEALLDSYPELAVRYGTNSSGIIEARFANPLPPS